MFHSDITQLHNFYMPNILVFEEVRFQVYTAKPKLTQKALDTALYDNC